MNNTKLKIDLQQVKNEWEQKGMICEIWELEPGNTWSDPGHKTDEVFVPLEGEIQVSCQGKTFLAGVGETVMVPALEPHQVQNIGEITSRVYWIHHSNYA